MKTFAAFLFATLLATSGFAADASIHFNALLAVGNDHRFVLTTPAGKVSTFLRVGEAFEGHVVKAYESKTGVLTLERDGRPLTLTLATDSARSGGLAGVTPATLDDASAVLDAMNFEEMMDKMLEGSLRQQGKMLDQLWKQFGAGDGDRAAMTEFSKRAMEIMMSGLKGSEMKEDMTRIYSEVFSKEELRALGTFYSTPLGKSFSEKQPVLSEKMNAVMAPRMMGAIPKVMQFAQDYGREQQAKRAAAREAERAAREAGGEAPPSPKNE